jgi:hypothetical protein
MFLKKKRKKEKEKKGRNEGKNTSLATNELMFLLASYKCLLLLPPPLVRLGDIKFILKKRKRKKTIQKKGGKKHAFGW